MPSRVERPGVREGYDRWAESYDVAENPLVALDRRHTLAHLRPERGERILDAGCGTGANLMALHGAGSSAVGIDLSRGMLRVARRKLPGIPLVQGTLDAALPIRPGRFDAVLCALVSEHLRNLGMLFGEAFRVLREGGRLSFSAFHPEIAAAGVEANFEAGGTEYRLGAERHTRDDYLDHIEASGFRDVRLREYAVDDSLTLEVPRARRYLGRPLLLVIDAVRPGLAWAGHAVGSATQ